jgi:hypothetical protein
VWTKDGTLQYSEYRAIWSLETAYYPRYNLLVYTKATSALSIPENIKSTVLYYTLEYSSKKDSPVS